MSLENSRQEITAEPKGILGPTLAVDKFRLARFKPAADLRFFVEYFWIVAWDLRGQEPHVQKTLPHPCVHLVFDRGKTAIFGVTRGAFDYQLIGQSRVLGVRFRPGGFRGVLGAPLTSITDRTIPLGAVYQSTLDATAEASVLDADDDDGMMRVAESILRTRMPAPDKNIDFVNSVVECVAADRTITRVDMLAKTLGWGERALQRLFSDYVGVSPKWVIRRSRLHDAASRLADDEDVNLTHLAQDLGYSDQAHFTRDFKTIVGRAPSDYRRSAKVGGL